MDFEINRMSIIKNQKNRTKAKVKRSYAYLYSTAPYAYSSCRREAQRGGEKIEVR